MCLPHEDGPAGQNRSQESSRLSQEWSLLCAQGPQLYCVWASAGIRADSAVCPVPSTLTSSPGEVLSSLSWPPDLEKPLGVLRV